MIARIGARRFVVGAMLAVAVLAFMAPPAPALSPLPITCNAAGTVVVVDGTPTDAWTVDGKGTCSGDFKGPYHVDFVGTGTSGGLGICDDSVIVRDLNLVVTATLKNTVTGKITVINEEWFALATVYPGVTPFLVATDNGKLGAGYLSNKIFLNCQGSPAATFVWTQMT